MKSSRVVLLRVGFLVASVMLAPLAAHVPASAADMPVKAVAPPAAAFTWNGSYFGGNVGYGWGPWEGTNPSNVTPSFAGNGGFTSTASPKVNGWSGGVQLGHNWQHGLWVAGLEADFQISGQKADAGGSATASLRNTDFIFTFAGQRTNEWKMPWFATFRGRLGVTPAETWLVYLTGGAAAGSFSYAATGNGTVTATTLGGGFVGSATQNLAASESVMRWGWTIGGGVEKAVARAWSVKAEYLYLDFGSRRFLVNTGLDADIRMRDHVVRLGLNHKFTSY